MKELTSVTYPRTRLWSQDYSEVLFDSEKDAGTAEEWFAASEHDDWLGMSIEYAESWKTRWAGRIARHADGRIERHQAKEFLQYLLVPPAVGRIEP